MFQLSSTQNHTQAVLVILPPNNTAHCEQRRDQAQLGGQNRLILKRIRDAQLIIMEIPGSKTIIAATVCEIHDRLNASISDAGIYNISDGTKYCPIGGARTCWTMACAVPTHYHNRKQWKAVWRTRSLVYRSSCFFNAISAIQHHAKETKWYHISCRDAQ